jgi:hypothetical protein
LRNRWGNCLLLGLNISYSHIYRQGNSCADKLSNHGHTVTCYTWYDTVLSLLHEEWLRDKLGLPCYRFD